MLTKTVYNIAKPIKIQKTKNTGKEMYNLLKELFPICRSITGNGVRKTLNILQREIPLLKMYEVPSGTKCFDWEIPLEWNIKDAYVIDPEGKKIIDFQKNNLHVLNYSLPINKTVNKSELLKHLYSIPKKPNAIPYVVSYYRERWGFCAKHSLVTSLREGKYKVYIDSTLEKGSLTYGELIIPGKTKKEIFISTYVCHPSMANNELSGPVVVTSLAKKLLSKSNYYTYRIIFVPETIGSIAYLSKNYLEMKKNIIAGFNVSCVGDNRTYSYLPTRNGDTISDEVIKHVLSNIYPKYLTYSFLDRGSDERQYNSIGIDLPVASIFRSKYGEYPEYHTSLDNLDLVSPEGLQGGYEVLKKCIDVLENNIFIQANIKCEPFMSKRGLCSDLGFEQSEDNQLESRTFINLVTYADGQTSLLDIAKKIAKPLWELIELVNILKKYNLIKIKR